MTGVHKNTIVGKIIPLITALLNLAGQSLQKKIILIYDEKSLIFLFEMVPYLNNIS
jgi:hypothetical protein